MTDKEKLEKIIAEIDNLVNHAVTANAPAFRAWKNETERFLIKRFGVDSYEYENFMDIKFSPTVYVMDTDLVKKCREGLTTSKLVFQSYLSEMEEAIVPIKPRNADAFNKVFIVHGHDGELKHAVARLVEKQGLDAIILSEQANKGKTIIEKFEENSDVSGAICLFTADDLGRAKADPDEQPRARQNVVFEAGYFMGKLGRERVVIIAESGLELPSDMQGIVYTNKNNWEVDVLKELKVMGYPIDFNKFFG
ncbi:MAG: nucleotide-binding protein [Bacteroides sp.]|nr:nucleotide-binding protein [Bacteroides sp.]